MRTLPPARAIDELSAIRTLIESAHDGDEDARNALATTARYLAIAAVNAINAFDPQVVFIGRELAAANELVLGPIRTVVAERAFTATGRTVPIERDPLGDDTPLLGAASLVLRELFLDTDVLGDLIVSSRPVNPNYL
jgi:predicted NBD/HSP70 family sugar kinase